RRWLKMVGVIGGLGLILGMALQAIYRHPTGSPSVKEREKPASPAEVKWPTPTGKPIDKGLRESLAAAWTALYRDNWYAVNSGKRRRDAAVIASARNTFTAASQS